MWVDLSECCMRVQTSKDSGIPNGSNWMGPVVCGDEKSTTFKAATSCFVTCARAKTCIVCGSETRVKLEVEKIFWMWLSEASAAGGGWKKIGLLFFRLMIDRFDCDLQRFGNGLHTRWFGHCVQMFNGWIKERCTVNSVCDVPIEGADRAIHRLEAGVPSLWVEKGTPVAVENVDALGSGCRALFAVHAEVRPVVPLARINVHLICEWAEGKGYGTEGKTKDHV